MPNGMMPGFEKSDTEVQIEIYLAGLRGYTGEEIRRIKDLLYARLRAARAGDVDARAELEGLGLTVSYVPGAPRPEVGAPGVPRPFGETGEFYVDDPATGTRVFYRREPVLDVYNRPTFDEQGNPVTRFVRTGIRPLAEGEIAETGWVGMEMRNLATAYEREEITEAQYQARLQELVLGAEAGVGVGVGGMTEYQAAQLELARQRLAQEYELAQRELALEQLGTAVQAARTGEPLTYLGMLRGQVPGAGGAELYRGVPRIVPAIPTAGVGIPQPAGVGAPMPTGARLPTPTGVGAPTPTGSPTEGGWVPPEMPPTMAAIQAGRQEQVKMAGLPAGVRIPHPITARRMSPYELAAQGELAEYQGVPRMDWESYRTILQRTAPSPARFATYGGRLRPTGRVM